MSRKLEKIKEEILTLAMAIEEKTYGDNEKIMDTLYKISGDIDTIRQENEEDVNRIAKILGRTW